MDKQGGLEVASLETITALTDMAMMTPTEAALEYVRLGYRVFPCDGKRPVSGFRWKEDAIVLDTARVAALFSTHPGANVAIAVPEDAIVLDTDLKSGVNGAENLNALRPPDGEPLGDCPTALTGSGGMHMWYRLPDSLAKNGNRRGRLPAGVDVRSGGRGYVVAPPSTHPDTGRPYAWIVPLVTVDELPILPAWVEDLLVPEKSALRLKPLNERPRGGGDRVENVLQAACDRVRHAENGTRNETLNRAAFTVAGALVCDGGDRDTAREVLADAAREVGLKDSEIRKTLNSAFNAGSAAPLPPREPMREQIRISEPRAGAKTQVPLFPLTDAGNGERMARGFKGKIRFCPPRGRWLLERGGRWFWDETRQIVQRGKETVRQILHEASQCTNDDTRKAIVTHARRSENLTRLNAVISFTATEPGIPVMPDELDANPYLLGCRNGTLNLQTGKLQRNSPADLITKSTPCDYVPEARSDLWETTLAMMTGHDPELANFLQRVAGYSLFGEVREKHFWFLYGPPDGGKSTFINAIVSTMGDYARAADFNTWLIQTNTGGNRGDIVDLMGSRLVVSVEARKGSRFDESIIKKVTGGDRLKFAAKYEREVEFTAQFALVLAANDAPVIRDDDEGVWSRVCRVPFTHPVPKDRQDKALGEKLATPVEMSALLTWAVKGFQQWQEDGLGTCQAVEASNATYRREMDRAEGFFEELCVFDTQAKIATRDLKQAYERWAADMGVYALNGREFNARLQARGCTPARVNKAKGWKGIRLKSEIELQNPNLSIHDGDREAQNGFF